jgi:hypothetical protein
MGALSMPDSVTRRTGGERAILPRFLPTGISRTLEVHDLPQ